MNKSWKIISTTIFIFIRVYYFEGIYNIGFVIIKQCKIAWVNWKYTDRSENIITDWSNKKEILNLIDFKVVTFGISQQLLTFSSTEELKYRILMRKLSYCRSTYSSLQTIRTLFFFLDCFAYMYSRKPMLHTRLWNHHIAEGFSVLRQIFTELFKKNRGSNFLQATVCSLL